MKHGAQPSDRISAPPIGPVVWVVVRVGPIRIAPKDRLRVTARRWFDARAEAAMLLECEPGDLEVALEGKW